jgi:hypothetical protein
MRESQFNGNDRMQVGHIGHVRDGEPDQYQKSATLSLI